MNVGLMIESHIPTALLSNGSVTMTIVAQVRVCQTTNQPNTKYNPNPNPNPDPTTKQHAIVNIQLNIVACPTYPEKFIRDNVAAPSVRLYIGCNCDTAVEKLSATVGKPLIYTSRRHQSINQPTNQSWSF